MLVISKLRKLRTPLLKVTLSALVASTACFASVNVTLTSSVSSGAPVGTTVLWTAHATDTTNSGANFVYQYSFGPSGGQLLVRRDFYTYNTFPWTPTNSEGSYDAHVIARNVSTGATGTATAVFNVSSRVTDGAPVVSRTNHPLVALYSMPACPTGQSARVRFKGPGDPIWQSTQTKSCTGSSSLNFYIAGMRASTTYEIQHDLLNGPITTAGPVFNFTTGAIPGNVSFAGYSLPTPYSAPNNTAYPIVLLSPVSTTPYATGTGGHIVWYLPPLGVPLGYFLRPVNGGTFLTFAFDGSVPAIRLFREYDVAGNLVRETNTATISEQLQARGADPVTTFHHDAIRLPNGGTALLGSVEKVADQGQGPVDVLGDEVIVLDENMRVVWSWNEFDHLDIKRKAVLGELCYQDVGGCPHLFNPKYNAANDWTHTNGLTLSPDGNMLVSSRHQDWIMKIRYQGGTGDGTLLWKLGPEGDFKTDSSVTNPWFSHQHNPEVTPDGRLTLFDNGNTREHFYGGNSRGQAWYLDQADMIAHLVYNVDLGAFSMATGSAQALSNGNYTFNLGFVGASSDTEEYTGSGVLVAKQSSTLNSYRSFRMRSLFIEH